MLDLESIPGYNHSIMSKYRISGALKTFIYLSKSGPRPKNLFFLAHLAKGNVSFCHHLASVVC